MLSNMANLLNLSALVLAAMACSVHGISVGDDVRYDLEDTGIGEYRLAFRAKAGNGQSVFEAYRTRDRVNVSPWSCCKQMTNTSKCVSHYRNHEILDTWENIDKVAFVLYNNGTKVKQLLFNGDGSTNMNWFSSVRLIDNPNSSLGWSDIKSESHNYFSISGDSRGPSRFFINRSYSSCPYNRGWVLISDGSSPTCYYEERIPYWPRFMYMSGDESSEWWDGPVRTADVMAVFVKNYSGDQCHM